MNEACAIAQAIAIRDQLVAAGMVSPPKCSIQPRDWVWWVPSPGMPERPLGRVCLTDGNWILAWHYDKQYQPRYCWVHRRVVTGHVPRALVQSAGW
jgi:hypothetical protein